MNNCKTCGVQLTTENTYKSGRYKRCIPCLKEKDRLYRLEHHEEHIARVRRYKQTPNGKASNLRSAIKNHMKNPTGFSARTKLRLAIEQGKLSRGNCYCGEKADAHHKDYSKPLDVVWLCRSHHLELHRTWRYLNNYYLGL